jgi:hypothetical protein
MLDNTFLHRSDASKYIGVSTRTLDRYISKGRLSTHKKNGNVMLYKEELDVIKDDKNTNAAQVIRSQTISPSQEISELSEAGKEIHKYKVLYKDAKNELDKKDELLKHMHYQLGILETESKFKIPRLDAQSIKQELEFTVKQLESDKNLLSQNLKTAKSGRSVFFLVSIILLVLLFIFFLIMGNMN